MLVSCLAYSLTLKMEATCTSEMSAEFQRITRRYIPEDKLTLYSRNDCHFPLFGPEKNISGLVKGALNRINYIAPNVRMSA
jgi:hypothetical protein